MSFFYRQRDPVTNRVIAVRRSVRRRNVIRGNPRRYDPHDDFPRYVIGLDLAQARDYSAIAILERIWPKQAASNGPVYLLHHIARFPLGTAYSKIIGNVETLMAVAPLSNSCRLVLDRTGVGAPVADMFLHAGLHPVPIHITGGQRAHIGGMTWYVPRNYLISVLQNLLQNQRIRFARDLQFAPILRKELINFSVRSHQSNEASMSWRENEHDDMVFAVMLACYYYECILRRRVPNVTIITS